MVALVNTSISNVMLPFNRNANLKLHCTGVEVHAHTHIHTLTFTHTYTHTPKGVCNVSKVLSAWLT